MSEQYTSINLILDKVLRHPLMQDLSSETAIDYTIDFMRIVGCPNMFENKVVTIEVNQYRALLPEDYYQVTQLRLKDGRAFRYTTDSFHLGETYKSNDLTYKIQGGIIFTSIENGEIELSYDAIKVDCNGYPMIPDNSSFTRALELYIKKQWFTILFDLGKITPQVLQNTQQEYAWAVGDCQSEFIRLNIDKAESFYNSIRTMIRREYQHPSGFINNGTKEHYRVH